MLWAVPALPAIAGLPAWATPAIIGGVFALGILILVMAVLRRRRPKEILCRSCHRVVLPIWVKCKFCGATIREMRAELEFVSGPLVDRRSASIAT